MPPLYYSAIGILRLVFVFILYLERGEQNDLYNTNFYRFVAGYVNKGEAAEDADTAEASEDAEAGEAAEDAGTAEATEEPAQDGTTTAAEEELFFVWHVYSCTDILPHGSGYAGGCGMAP